MTTSYLESSETVLCNHCSQEFTLKFSIEKTYQFPKEYVCPKCNHRIYIYDYETLEEEQEAVW